MSAMTSGNHRQSQDLQSRPRLAVWWLGLALLPRDSARAPLPTFSDTLALDRTSAAVVRIAMAATASG